jgi:hypothetical protein
MTKIKHNAEFVYCALGISGGMVRFKALVEVGGIGELWDKL